MILGTCARCGKDLPGTHHHPQELPCVFIDPAGTICAKCGALYSLVSHSCFLDQWIDERKRWPLSNTKGDHR